MASSSETPSNDFCSASAALVGALHTETAAVLKTQSLSLDVALRIEAHASALAVLAKADEAARQRIRLEEYAEKVSQLATATSFSYSTSYGEPPTSPAHPQPELHSAPSVSEEEQQAPNRHLGASS